MSFETATHRADRHYISIVWGENLNAACQQAGGQEPSKDRCRLDKLDLPPEQDRTPGGPSVL